MPLRHHGLPADREHSLLSVLVRVAIASNLATSLEAAGQIAVSAICEVTGWGIGHLYVVDTEDADQLISTNVWCTSDHERFDEFRSITAITPLRRGVGLPGRVLASQQPVWITDVTKDENFPRGRNALDLGIKAAFAVPVLSGSSVLGVLEFFNAKAIEPDDALLHVLAQVGSQLGRVAERERAEGALRASESRFRALAQSAVDAIVSADRRGQITFWNESAERLFGHTAAEALGQPLTLLMPERFHAAHTQGIARVGQGGAQRVIGRTVELAGLRKNGEEFPLELSLSKWNAGAEMFFTGIIRDTSERKRVEGALRDTEDALRQAAKLESIGKLAGGVAHDFNNLLTVIVGYVEMLRMSELPARQSRMVDRIRNAADRASSLTQRLLAFSRKQLLQPAVINPGDLILGMEDMLRRLVGEHVDVTVNVTRDVWPVKVDPNQAEQMVLNLAINARDAMPDGGRLTIGLENRSLPQGEYVVLTVADNGSGMDPATQARVFEPFFTTKPVDKGTGLGLAMAHGFVNQSGGFIQLDSDLGRGTTFSVFLPSASGQEVSAAAVAPDVELPKGTETILVVEDEAEVRVLLVEALKGAGYAVLSAARPEEAIRISHRHPGQIALVVSDVVMPEMAGPKLVERIAEEQTRMRVLYISGYADDEFVQRGLQERSINFLQKPFELPAMLAMVRRVLDFTT